jgi:hypothetical protein
MTQGNKQKVYFYIGALLAFVGVIGLGYSIYTLLSGTRNQDYLKIAGFSLASLFMGAGNVWYYWNTMFHHGHHDGE